MQQQFGKGKKSGGYPMGALGYGTRSDDESSGAACAPVAKDRGKKAEKKGKDRGDAAEKPKAVEKDAKPAPGKAGEAKPPKDMPKKPGDADTKKAPKDKP